MFLTIIFSIMQIRYKYLRYKVVEGEKYLWNFVILKMTKPLFGALKAKDSIRLYSSD